MAHAGTAARVWRQRCHNDPVVPAGAGVSPRRAGTRRRTVRLRTPGQHCVCAPLARGENIFCVLFSRQIMPSILPRACVGLRGR
jgi:hypothetical protein